MKSFFEEYGLVLVVIIIVGGMLVIGKELPNRFEESIESAWGEFMPNGDLWRGQLKYTQFLSLVWPL